MTRGIMLESEKPSSKLSFLPYTQKRLTRNFTFIYGIMLGSEILDSELSFSALY